jgi:hypothetical protein
LQPEAQHGGAREKGASFAEKLEDVSAASISKACFVLRYNKPLLYSVLNGAITPNSAYFCRRLTSSSIFSEQLLAITFKFAE